MQIIVSLNGLSLSIKNKLSRTYAVTASFLTKLLVSSLKKESKVHLLFFLSVDGKMKKKKDFCKPMSYNFLFILLLIKHGRV